jgi:signal transduction histidine kinase
VIPFTPHDGQARPRLLGVAVAASTVTAVTLALYPLTGLDPGVSSGALYILGALLVATYWGLWLGLPTSIASALALDYFHAPPFHSFRIAESSDVAAIVVLLVTAIVVSLIADRARLRTEDARARLALEEELRQVEAERIRLDAARASGARVMEAANEERRRVVRDLHDGAQQRLVHTVIALKLARRALDAHDPDARQLVGEALGHAEQATVALRELSRGILPSTLTRGGLRAGIDALVSRAPLPVSVEVPGERLPVGIEATAYFVVAEALTNIVKHSRASSAAVSAIVEDHLLRLEIRDDGVGGARRDGNGLMGLGDRVAVLDGRLRIESPAAGGTLVAAELPLPAQRRGGHRDAP